MKGKSFTKGNDNNKWLVWFLVFILILILPTIVSIFTNFWGLSAISVGLLLGLALQKGDLCGSSAMSEVILFKDSSKIFGLWVSIVSSMVFFAILHQFGAVELAPKKFIWLNALVGGFIFGFGTVFAGGCISGCLYKAASGNVNSLVALLTIPIGISFVDYGFFNPLQERMLKFVINGTNGEPLSLYSITGFPYWSLTLIFIVITIAIAYFSGKKKKNDAMPIQKNAKTIVSFIRKPWKPWQSGIFIGFVGMLAWLSSLPTGRNYPLGVTHGVSYIYQFMIEKNVQVVTQKQISNPRIQQVQQKQNIQQASSQQASSLPQPRKINFWLMMLVLGLIVGAFLSAKMTGNFKLLPKPPEQIVVAGIGGFIVGVGAAIGTGCVIGNIISGWAMMSLSMFLFGITTLLGNWLATYFYLIGRTNKK